MVNLGELGGYREPAMPEEEPTLGETTIEERALWDAVFVAALNRAPSEGDANLYADAAVKRRRKALGRQ